MENKPKKPGMIQGLLVLLFVSITFYFLARSVFIIFAKYQPLEKILAVLFLIAEIFVMFQAFGYFGTIYRLNRKRPEHLKTAPIKDEPSVAILVAARHEPKDILESTLLSLYNLDYKNKTIYILDDSSEDRYHEEAAELAKEYGLKVFRREVRHGAKAGIINDCLKGCTDKYVAVFDVDQNPISGFLNTIIPILEGNPKLSFVQTPQFYSNLSVNKISFASNMQQAVFYEYICEGKSSSDAMICCGTNVIFRREALVDVGGLDEATVTEDFATSIKFHMKGWESLYYNHVHTFGMGPEDMGSYFKQQNRWAMGNLGVFRNIIKNIIRSPFALKPLQWFEYFITGSYYLISWAYLFLMLCPVLYLFFGIPSFFMNPVVYALAFLPYLVLSISIFQVSMVGRGYTMKQMFKGQLLSFITLPVYMRASLLGAIGMKGTFQVTAKGGSKALPYSDLWPQLALWAISLSAITWGANRYLYEPTAAIAINVGWIAYHFLLLSGVFYFNEDIITKIPCKKISKKVKFEYAVVEENRGQYGLNKDTWKACMEMEFEEKIVPGALVMVKLHLPGGNDLVIFDAEVLASSGKKRAGGFRTELGVVTISGNDRIKLNEVLEK